MTAIIALSMLLGYAGSFVGIPPVVMFALVSTCALLGEYIRRLVLYYYHRQNQQEIAP